MSKLKKDESSLSQESETEKDPYRTEVKTRYSDQDLLDKLNEFVCRNETAMLQPYLESGHYYFVNLPESEVFEVMSAWAEKPSLESLILLLNSGVHVNSQDHFGNGFLHYAGTAHEDLRDIVNFLVARGIDMNMTNYLLETPLIHSMRNIATIKVRVLLQYSAVDVNKQDCHGGTALMYAARCGRDDVIKWLVAAGADVNLQDAKGFTALIWSDGNIAVAKALLENGADPNIVDCSGNNALYMALEEFTQGHFEIVKLLVDHGADVNAVNRFRPTKMALSICFEKCIATRRLMVFLENPNPPERFLTFLLERGANPTLPTYRHSLMHTAVIENFLNMIPYLIACGVAPFKTRVDASHGVHMYSQFFLALITSNLQLAKYFVKNWFLTPCDVQALYRGPRLLQGLNECCLSFYTGIKEFLAETASKPMSLTALSCIKTSALIGSTSDRRKKIESLCLPQYLKEKLLFDSLEGELKPDNDVKRFLHWAERSICIVRSNHYHNAQCHLGRSSPNSHFYTCNF